MLKDVIIFLWSLGMQHSAQILDIKRLMFQHLKTLAEANPAATQSALEDICAATVQWRMSHPISEVVGIQSAFEKIWLPLQQALPDLERRDSIFVGGLFEGRHYVAAVGHYCGTFEKPWLGIPATNAPLFLRYGEVYEIKDGKVVQANCLWDVLDVMRQACVWPLGPSRGREGRWPAPLNGGVELHEADPAQSARSIAQTLAMHKTLGDYNDTEMKGREGLLAMPQREHWHPKMMWYGPAGIGTTRGLSGFVDHHQLPFRLAFPNRKGGNQWDELAAEKKRLGGGHYIHIGDGPFSVTGGWPSVLAVDSGSGYMGLPATGRTITMRVMDFYFHDEGLIRENWVPLDMLDVLNQLGLDVFERLPILAAAPKSG
jgi:predicted ester cyclase